MLWGPLLVPIVFAGSEYSVIELGEPGLSTPILSAPHSVNQILPSGPAVIPAGVLEAVEIGYSVSPPLGVIFPILLPLNSVNQMFPSGPAAMALGFVPVVGNSLTVPVVVMLATWLTSYSANQSLPSGPAV